MKNILEKPAFVAILADIAKSTGRDFEHVKSEAETYLKELYTEQRPLFKALTAQGGQMILSMAYAKTIDVNPQEIKRLAKIMRRHPVAFVMTHKTYIDMFVLGLVLVRHGLPWPYIFGGNNLNFMGLGDLGKRTGIIFIRREFKENAVYKSTLKHYISHLVDEKSHFMWAIEGTRSRTGKLVWPKMGILKYIADAEVDSKEEVRYIPVSVVYDLIPDVNDMTKEGRGEEKKSENLLWMVNYIKNMRNDFGKISVRFGEPVKKDAEALAIIPGQDILSGDRSYTLPRFAFELVHAINRITPVTTTSLICTTLLSKFALTKHNMESDIVSLMQLIENHKPDALVDRGKPIGESVQIAINLLKKAKLIHQIGEGIKAKYAIVTDNYLSATYYSNMSVHYLYHRAFIELALLKVANHEPNKRIIHFWKEIMSLRDMFKFEFFYSNKSRFSDEIEQDLDFLDPEWKKRIKGTTEDVHAMLRDQKILVSHVVLFTYVEAYRVVLRALQTWDLGDEYSEKQLLKYCVFLGEEMHWQGRIHRLESVSKPFLLNGIRLAKNNGLIPTPSNTKRDKILEFGALLDNIDMRISELQGMVLSRDSSVRTIIPLERNMVPGSRTESITAPIMSGERGPHIGAFFDLDRTLIKGFSAKEFFQTRLLSGRMSAKEIIAQFNGALVYTIGNRNFAGLAAISAKGVQGVREQVFIDVGEEVYEKHLAKAIYPESRALVSAHLAMGHTVAIISAATPYQVNPIARDLDIEHIMCTRMEVANGKFTGAMIEPTCWGEGKAIAARELAEKLDIDFSKSHFYTDSVEDLPLLELVGHPHPINPDKELSALAFKNDWPIYRFDDESTPGIENVIRTLLAASSLLPVAATGAISGLMSLSRSEGVNSMIAVLGDLGAALAGIKLAVKGNENLWIQRPAVFIFNHQSNADMFINAKLLRKDVVAIAKKELKFSPVGPLLMAAGVVFIDRANKDKAIEAMQPVIDALKGGTSVAIAPEGTRSFDKNLGLFKKGAFHLAMAAGVPIVPIVIMNAHDVMPRGANLLRPNVVEVKVLEPIDCSDWTRANMNEKIEEVRNLYLKELGQIEILELSETKI